MSQFVALIAAIVLRETLLTTRKLGLSLLLAGTLVIVGWHAAAWSTSRTFGHPLFLSAEFLWACFTVVVRPAKIDPPCATARLHRIIYNLSVQLPSIGRNPSRANTARGYRNSDDFPGRSRD
jgi:drug/metabolite transporter (DMT)-like permease